MTNDITLTLPDGTQKVFARGITGEDVAKSIGEGLFKAALAIKIDDQLRDLYLPINDSANISIVTNKSPEGLELIRHDAAHLLAEAIKELYPKTQITIGPAVENGFYYDVLPEQTLTLDELPLIEAKMHEISNRNENVRREEWKRDDAIEYFKSIGEFYKAEIISQIPQGEIISLYRQGEFIDLCRGPHAPSTGKIKYFKLLKIAGAYWRGNSDNQMLTRIYGTAWGSEKELKDYLHLLEEAEKRDHRKLGKELHLFHFQEEAPGMVFWHDRGWTLYRTVENYIRNKIRANGYVEVKTPILLDRSLWEKSGHWEKFKNEMFVVETDARTYAIKPMNCPCHVQIFKTGLHSYRDLPLRMAEFGNCHRNETSGAMHGLMRVRSMVQDDAHIFCMENQISDETRKFSLLLQEVYRDFGFTDEVKVKFADRPVLRVGSDETWDKAENALKEAVIASNLSYTINSGEGAFYGPKLEFYLKDAIGREWQCGTLQVDFNMPERLDASYIGEDGQKYRPVMIHRAILGSLERFIGILIEQYAGKFPLWLSPVQAIVLPITNNQDAYVRDIVALLHKNNVRANHNLSSDKISYKIRQAALDKIPITLIVGAKEMSDQTVVVRKFGVENQETLALSDLISIFSAKS